MVTGGWGERCIAQGAEKRHGAREDRVDCLGSMERRGARGCGGRESAEQGAERRRGSGRRGARKAGGGRAARVRVGSGDSSFIPCQCDPNRQIVDGWSETIGPGRPSQKWPITTSDCLSFSFSI